MGATKASEIMITWQHLFVFNFFPTCVFIREAKRVFLCSFVSLLPYNLAFPCYGYGTCFYIPVEAQFLWLTDSALVSTFQISGREMGLLNIEVSCALLVRCGLEVIASDKWLSSGDVTYEVLWGGLNLKIAVISITRTTGNRITEVKLFPQLHSSVVQEIYKP